MEKLDEGKIRAIEKNCLEMVKQEQLYLVRNDAKLRAVQTSKTYDEFK